MCSSDLKNTEPDGDCETQFVPFDVNTFPLVPGLKDTGPLVTLATTIEFTLAIAVKKAIKHLRVLSAVFCGLTELLNNVLFYPFVNDELYIELLKNADLLLVHERESLRDMSFPSKLTSYYMSQKPILVVCSKASATYGDVKKHKLLHCDPGDPHLLATLLSSYNFKSKSITYKVETNKFRNKR